MRGRGGPGGVDSPTRTVLRPGARRRRWLMPGLGDSSRRACAAHEGARAAQRHVARVRIRMHLRGTAHSVRISHTLSHAAPRLCRAARRYPPPGAARPQHQPVSRGPWIELGGRARSTRPSRPDRHGAAREVDSVLGRRNAECRCRKSSGLCQLNAGTSGSLSRVPAVSLE